MPQDTPGHYVDETHATRDRTIDGAGQYPAGHKLPRPIGVTKHYEAASTITQSESVAACVCDLCADAHNSVFRDVRQSSLRNAVQTTSRR